MTIGQLSLSLAYSLSAKSTKVLPDFLLRKLVLRFILECKGPMVGRIISRIKINKSGEHTFSGTGTSYIDTVRADSYISGYNRVQTTAHANHQLFSNCVAGAIETEKVISGSLSASYAVCIGVKGREMWLTVFYRKARDSPPASPCEVSLESP